MVLMTNEEDVVNVYEEELVVFLAIRLDGWSSPDVRVGDGGLKPKVDNGLRERGSPIRSAGLEPIQGLRDDEDFIFIGELNFAAAGRQTFSLHRAFK